MSCIIWHLLQWSHYIFFFPLKMITLSLNKCSFLGRDIPPKLSQMYFHIFLSLIWLFSSMKLSSFAFERRHEKSAKEFDNCVSFIIVLLNSKQLPSPSHIISPTNDDLWETIPQDFPDHTYWHLQAVLSMLFPVGLYMLHVNVNAVYVYNVLVCYPSNAMFHPVMV